MARRAVPFTQREVARALKAATAAGLTVRSYTVDRDGRIQVTTGAPAAATVEDQALEALARWQPK